MLIKTMTPVEVNREIMLDYKVIGNSSTHGRLNNEYLEQRKKLKIDKGAEYPLFKCFKTKSKNPWMLMIRKHPESESVQSKKDIVAHFITHYYTDKGLRVFVATETGVLLVYNGHLFTRYKERMALKIDDPLNVVKHFFTNNTDNLQKLYPKDENNNVYFMSIAKEGYLMGTFEINLKGAIWFIHKTFVAHDTASAKHQQSTLQLRYVLAEQLLKWQNGGVKELDYQIRLLAHEKGLMQNDKIVGDLSQIITDTGALLKDPVNEGIHFF